MDYLKTYQLPPGVTWIAASAEIHYIVPFLIAMLAFWRLYCKAPKMAPSRLWAGEVLDRMFQVLGGHTKIPFKRLWVYDGPSSASKWLLLSVCIISRPILLAYVVNRTRILLHASICDDTSEWEKILFWLGLEMAFPIIFTCLERWIWATLAVQLQVAAVELTFDLTIDSEAGPRDRTDPSRLLHAVTNLQSAFSMTALRLVPSTLRLALLSYDTISRFGCKAISIMLLTAFLWAAVSQEGASSSESARKRFLAARDSSQRLLGEQTSSWELIVLSNRQCQEKTRLCVMKNDEDHQLSRLNLYDTCYDIVLESIITLGRALCMTALRTEDMLLLAEHWTDLLSSFVSVWRVIRSFRISLDAEVVSNALVNCTRRGLSGNILAQCRGQISLEDVCFAYKEGIPALRGVTFHVKPGQAVAIVGANGAGKSTILRLILQLIKHNRGSLQIDGYDTRDLNACSIRSHIGFVPQNPTLMQGLSIRDNLTYGLEKDIDLEVIQALCQQLGLHQHIFRFSDGYDTLIGPGVDLSGGQRQLVALARVLLRDPPVLLLDEPTSQLDNLAQKKVWKILQARRMTKLLITHRLSFLREVDEILVLDKGRIIERGSHEVLISGQAYYQDLFLHEG